MPLGEKHTPDRAEARRRIEEQFNHGNLFGCRTIGKWILAEEDEHRRWHLWKAFDELRREGKVVRVSGCRRSTVYRWVLSKVGGTMGDVKKLPKWAQDEIEVLKMRIQEIEKRARAYEEKQPTKVYIRHLHYDPNDKPLYLPDDKQIRFVLGEADWQYVDIRLRRTSEQKELFVELMAGGDIHIAPEVRNVSKIFVR